MSIDIRALLGSAYKPGDGSADGAQIVDLHWWHPVMGCDSLQIVVDRARVALAAESEREGPTLKEVSEWICKEDPNPGDFGYQHHDVMRIVLAALARWGRPVQPAPSTNPSHDRPR